MTVRLFYGSETGLGQSTGVAGALIALLDKILVNGFNSQSLTSITRSGATATVGKTAHGFRSGQTVNQSGWDQAEYNGNFVIFNVTANTYDITVTGTPTTPGTGTATGKVAAVGWTKPYNGTNKAVYRPSAGNQFYLRIDDAGTTQARSVGYEAMTDVDTGTNAFPTAVQFAGGLYWPKSGTANATVRDYVVIADEKRFYWIVDQASDSWNTAQGAFFGDIKTYKAGDTYHTLIIAQPTATVSNSSNLYNTATNPATAQSGHYMARAFSQIGGSVACGKIIDYCKANQTTAIGSGGASYPDPVSGSLNVCPVFVHESSVNGIRGELPGVLAPLHARPLNTLDTYEGTDDYAGLNFISVNMYSAAQMHFQINGTMP